MTRIGLVGPWAPLRPWLDHACAQHGDVALVDAPATSDVALVAGSWTRGTAALSPGTPAVGAALRPVPLGAPASATAARVPAAGWLGGLGTLLARRALRDLRDPVELHVAYAALPGPVRATRQLPGTVRAQVLGALLAGPGTARIDGADVPEPVAAGRRLAWFPRPVGPWHAAAVPGHEAAALPHVPTVRTWLAVGSLAAEGLQAVGRLDPAGAPAQRLARLLGATPDEAARSGAGSGGPDWAVVVEARSADGTVERAWANGTDPLAATAHLLVLAARATPDAPPGTTSVADLGDATALLDALADARALRWSVARPVT